MAILSDASHKQADASIRFDPFFIRQAFLPKIRSKPIEDIGILFFDIDMPEKVVPHETVVALGMIRIQPDIFIHVESDDIGKGNFPALVQPDQLFVHPQRGGTGGQSQDEWFAGGGLVIQNSPGDCPCGPHTHLFRCLLENNAHDLSSLAMELCWFMIGLL